MRRTLSARPRRYATTIGRTALMALVMAVGVVAPVRASASLAFDDGLALGSAAPGSPSTVADVTVYVNHLAALAPGATDAADGQAYTRSLNDLGALPQASSSGAISATATTISLGDPNAYVYAVAIYPDEAFAWYIGGVTGGIVIPSLHGSLGLSGVVLLQPAGAAPPPPPTTTAIIAADATCAAVMAGTAAPLASLEYKVKPSGWTLLNADPGRFSYWVSVDGTEGANALAVSQAITAGSFDGRFTLARGSKVYDGNCGDVKGTFSQQGDGTVDVSWRGRAVGRYVVRVTYVSRSILAFPAPASSVEASFEAATVAGSIAALELRPKD